jgi:hypothetical protein
MEQNEQEVVSPQQIAKTFFEIKEVALSDGDKPQMPPNSVTPSDVVEQIFNGAVVEMVKNDDNVKREILDGAKATIRNKTNAIKDNTETEAKEAHFNNNKGACECFGFTETSTERWAVTMMSFWHRIMTAIWIVIGFVTYAPVVFIAHKVSVIIKKTWIAVLVAGLIYGAMATSPLWIGLIARIGGMIS